jgi:hypothetical protein
MIFLTLSALVLACTFTPTVCRAATSSASPLVLKIGALFPGSSDSRDLGGDTQFVLGLEYTLQSLKATSTATSIYLDYIGGSKNSGSVHSTGFGVAFRSSGSGYFGAGIGIYGTNITFDNDEDDPFRTSTSATGAGGKVFGGFELGNGVQLEVDYHILPSAGGVNPSGAALEVGIRL